MSQRLSAPGAKLQNMSENEEDTMTRDIGARTGAEECAACCSRLVRNTSLLVWRKFHGRYVAGDALNGRLHDAAERRSYTVSVTTVFVQTPIALGDDMRLYTS